ncbi:ketohexokinase [Geosmithia morbida]|uniref:Ketohexokinase n=1 Tax=Geosmithia morbida TaxID=1094350 RepID=A0A9P4YMC4_9HYPO|nr:ketohexokinase [Geosmithia morbida]KAF4119616.1 ketohexokinase [Geosmithia morbida]
MIESHSKLRATNLVTRRGGNCPNSLEVLQQLLLLHDPSVAAVRPYLVTCLPGRSTASSRRVFSSFDGPGPDGKSPIDFTHCIHREGRVEAASSYAIRSAETGSRTLVSYNDLDDMTVGEFERVVRSFDPKQSTWWHFEGRIPDITLACINLLRRLLPGAKISVEVERPGRLGLMDMAAEADVVFYSRTWAEDQGHDSAEACLRNQDIPKASLALCTWGSKGAVALSRFTGHDSTSTSTAGIIHCPVPGNVTTVVDTLGAGDTFVAGMLYGLLCHADWDTERQVNFAVHLASLKVQQDGFARLGDAVREAGIDLT